MSNAARRITNRSTLYWAYASLPANLVDMNGAYAFERNVLYEQIKVLKEVNENPRSVGYWNDFIDCLAPQLKVLEMEGLAVFDQERRPKYSGRPKWLCIGATRTS